MVLVRVPNREAAARRTHTSEVWSVTLSTYTRVAFVRAREIAGSVEARRFLRNERTRTTTASRKGKRGVLVGATVIRVALAPRGV